MAVSYKKLWKLLIDKDLKKKDLVGYEISFSKYFYHSSPMRGIHEIINDLVSVETMSDGMLSDIIGVART